MTRRVGVLALALLLVLAPAVRAAPPRRIVLVYGDSLVWEARSYLHTILHDVAGVDERIATFPGGATCDALPTMQRDAAQYRPALVIMAFSGNDLTPCMQDGHGHQLQGQAVLDKYRADTVRAIATFRQGAPPVWLGTSPIALVPWLQHEDGDAKMTAMLRGVAATNNRRIHVTDSGAAVLDHGWWTATLPCLPREPCIWGVDTRGNRVNRVRSNDGTHFCPIDYRKFEDCPIHSSGALRFALGLSVIPMRSMGWYDERKAALSMGAGFTP
jgi:hypothetical protein